MQIQACVCVCTHAVACQVCLFCSKRNSHVRSCSAWARRRRFPVWKCTFWDPSRVLPPILWPMQKCVYAQRMSREIKAEFHPCPCPCPCPCPHTPRAPGNLDENEFFACKQTYMHMFMRTNMQHGISERQFLYIFLSAKIYQRHMVKHVNMCRVASATSKPHYATRASKFQTHDNARCPHLSQTHDNASNT